MAIARYPTVVLDCADPDVLAAFYAELLGWTVRSTPSGAVIDAEYGDSIEFHRVEGYRPPDWPGQQMPQQMHLDVVVDDLEEAEPAVVALGGVVHDHQPGTSFRVFLDPAGHPFCLCAA